MSTLTPEQIQALLDESSAPLDADIDTAFDDVRGRLRATLASGKKKFIDRYSAEVGGNTPPENKIPTATAQQLSVISGNPVTATLGGVDPEGVILTFELVSQPTSGSLGSLTNNSVTYTPNASYVGNDSFAFRVSDGVLWSEPATVSIEVAPVPVVNKAPVAVAQTLTAVAGKAVTITLAGTDPDNNVLTFEIVARPTKGTLGAINKNAVIYTANGTTSGSDSFSFRVNDGKVWSDAATVSITVSPAPVVVKFVSVHEERWPHDVAAADGTMQHVNKTWAIPTDRTNVRFMADNGSDSGTGSETQPWKTMKHALAHTPAGGTLIVADPLIREGDLSTPAGRKYTVQAHPEVKPVIKGSVVVTGWTKNTTLGLWEKTNWPYLFKRSDGSPMGSYIDYKPVASSPYIRSTALTAAYPDQIWIDGKRLDIADSKSTVTAGKFWVDYPTATAYIYDDPTNKTVEAAAKKKLMTVNGPVTLRGLMMMMSAGHRDTLGDILKITSGGAFTKLQGMVLGQSSAGTALHNSAPDVTIEDSIFAHCGNTCAGGGGSGLRWRMFRSRFMYGNMRDYDWWEGAAFKTGRQQYGYMEDCVFEETPNRGSGLWHDVAAKYNTMLRCVARNNGSHGFMYEISSDADFLSCIARNNGFIGFYIYESERVRLVNPTAHNNGQEDICLREHNRAMPLRDVEVVNGIFSQTKSTSNPLTRVQDQANVVRGEEFTGLKIHYSAYYKGSTNAPLMTWENGPDGTDSIFTTLSAMQSQTPHGDNSMVLTANPFVSSTTGNLRLLDGSAPKGKGKPLSTADAAKMGVPAGVPVDMGAL